MFLIFMSETFGTISPPDTQVPSNHCSTHRHCVSMFYTSNLQIVIQYPDLWHIVEHDGYRCKIKSKGEHRHGAKEKCIG